MCVFFLHRQGSRSGGFIAQHNRLNMSIAMLSACSKHLIKVVSKMRSFTFKPS